MAPLPYRFLKNVFTVFSWDEGGVGFASLIDGKAQTVATDSSADASTSTIAASSSTAVADAGAVAARQYGGPGFGGPGYGGGSQAASTSTSASTTAVWTSVSVKATAATGTGVYWASGVSSPTAGGESVRTGSVKLVNGAASAKGVHGVGAGAGALVVAMVMSAGFVWL